MPRVRVSVSNDDNVVGLASIPIEGSFIVNIVIDCDKMGIAYYAGHRSTLSGGGIKNVCATC